jgi:small subunit ribosomal protein S6
MKTKRERLYEGMYILNATLSEEARKKALAKIVDGITTKGGKIKKTHDMGKKRLCYEIQGKREGYYYLIYFDIETSHIADLWQEYHLHEDLLRYNTIQAQSVKETLEFKPFNARQE